MPDSRDELRLTELGSLIRVIGKINSSLEIGDVLQAGRQGIQRVFNGTFGYYVLISRDLTRLELALADELAPGLGESLQALVRDFPVRNPDPDALYDNLIVRLGDRVREIMHSFFSESSYLIPLTARQHPIGILVVGSAASKILVPHGVDLLFAIGEQIGMAIENARLHASLRASEQWARDFMEESIDGFWEGDLDRRIRYVNEAACQILGYTREEIQNLRLEDLWVNPEASARAGRQLRQTGYLKNITSQVRTKSGEIKVTSLSTHLMRDEQGRAIGYQTIFRDVTEQQRAVDLIERQNRELDVLNTIGTILSRPLQMMQDIDKVCEQIVSITGMETVAIYLMDQSKQWLDLKASRGVDEFLLSQVQRLGLDDALTRSIAVDGRAIPLDDMTSAATEGLAGPRAAGYHAGIGVPIKTSKPFGAIFVGSKSLYKFEPPDVALLGNIGERVGMALENHALYSEMQSRVHELEGLANLSAANSSSLNPDLVSELAVQWTQQLLQGDMCSLRLRDGDMMRYVAARYNRDFKLAERIPLTPFFSSILEGHAPVAVNDVESDTRLTEEERRGFQSIQLAAFLFAPMRVREPIGLLMVGQTRTRHWSEGEMALLQTIANQTANAIDNAQLFQSISSEQRKIQAIFDSGLSGFYVTDAEGHINMFNRAAERMTQWSLAEVKGKKWADVFPTSTTEGVSCSPLIDEALQYNRIMYVPEGREIRIKDGRLIPVAKAVAPLVDASGRVSGAVGAFWDLTREKTAELNRESFLSVVAHEMRNPLTTIISALELLDMRSLPARHRRDALGLLKDQSQRLKQFSEDFLAVESRIRSFPPVHRQDLDIADIVKRLVQEFRIQHPQRTLKLRSSKPEPLVFADRMRINHIIRNLLDNAIAYSKDNCPVTVRVCELEGKGMVDVSVEDQGPGIAISDQSRIFESFYRARQTASVVHGHGLGLYIALEMARQMEATVELESDTARGSTFHLILRRSS